MDKRFSRSEVLFITFVATLSILLKPYMRAPFAFVQPTLGLPVGVFTGGLYMFWPMAVVGAIRKPGAGLFFCVLQGFVALVSGFTGLLGPLATFSYIVSGAAIEAVCYIGKRVFSQAGFNPPTLVIAGGLANLTGAVFNAMVFFVVRGEAVGVMVVLSFLTGGFGGLLASMVAGRIRGLLWTVRE